MTITNGYATLAEYKAFANITSTNATDDAVIEAMIESASRTIDNLCERHFYAATTTRYFTAQDGRVLYCDDISTATAMALYTDEGGDGTYENTWATTDFNLEPINALNGWPFTSIVITINGNYSFPVNVPRGVKITAAFGWAAIPKPIHEACMLIAASDYKQRNGETMGDVAQVTSAGVVLTPGGIPKSAMQKLTPYMRLV